MTNTLVSSILNTKIKRQKTLYDVYKDFNQDIKPLLELRNKIWVAIECPCEIKEECIHNIIPNNEYPNGYYCASHCPYNEIYHEFYNEVKQLIRKYIY